MPTPSVFRISLQLTANIHTYDGLWRYLGELGAVQTDDHWVAASTGDAKTLADEIAQHLAANDRCSVVEVDPETVFF